MKLSKTQLSKMIQSGGFLGRFFGPFLKTGLPLIKNVIKPLAKIDLILLGLTAATSAADAGIHKKILQSGRKYNTTTTLIISNDKIEDIIKIEKSLEDSGILLKGVTDIFVLDLLILCLQERRYLDLQIFFHQITLTKIMI